MHDPFFYKVNYCQLVRPLTLARAGEGEFVRFAGDCSCEGPVEVWLQNVVDAMRGAISVEFKAAMPAYAEKARTQWLYENSAQTTIIVSRVFYTQEICEAFAEMENGNEDAIKVRGNSVVHLSCASKLRKRGHEHGQ